MTKRNKKRNTKNCLQKMIRKIFCTDATSHANVQTTMDNDPSSRNKTCNNSYRHSLLIQSCKNNPKLEDISKLLKENPYAVFDTDNERRLPLHVACQYGACPEVIKELLEANKAATIVKDKSGMLPIHRACSFYHKNSDQEKSKEAVEKSLVEVLQNLLRVVPRSILEEDDVGATPVDHATQSDLSRQVVHALQRQSQKEKEREIVEMNSFGI